MYCLVYQQYSLERKYQGIFIVMQKMLTVTSATLNRQDLSCWVWVRQDNQNFNLGWIGRCCLFCRIITKKTHFIASVVNFNIISINIYLFMCIIEYCSRSRVPRVARHIVRYHQDNLTVRNTQPLHTPIDRQYVRDMTIVEPKPRRIHQNSPVVCVVRLLEVLWNLN